MPGHHAQESRSRTLFSSTNPRKIRYPPQPKNQNPIKFASSHVFSPSSQGCQHPTRSRPQVIEKSPRLVSALGAAVAAMLREWLVAVMNGGQSGHDHLITAHGKYFDLRRDSQNCPIRKS